MSVLMDTYMMRVISQIAVEIGRCKRCPLHRVRNNAVPGEGGFRKGVFFIGEAPGRMEDRTGRPFAGAAGKILDTLLGYAGLEREDVFITSILKCRPPGNRDPSQGEVSACKGWLRRQMEVMKPRFVVPLGRHALFFLRREYSIPLGSISEERGRPSLFVFPWGEGVVLPTYHPAAVIYRRQWTPLVEEDFKTLARLIREST